MLSFACTWHSLTGTCVFASLHQVDIVLKMVTALSGEKGKSTKDKPTLAVLTTAEGQKSLIQQLLIQTSLD